MNRRDFLRRAAAASALCASSRAIRSDGHDGDERLRRDMKRQDEKIDAANIPRWRGFNLQEMFGWGRKPTFFSEVEFELMADWGFDFVRLPMSYWNWADPKDWLTINEKPFKYIDHAIELGKQYGIHVNLNLHRIPGYCVTRTEDEPAQLFHGPPEARQEALRAAVHHWTYFAKRYKGIPNARLSFDLMNEPPFATLGPKLTKLLRAQLPEFAKYLINEADYVEVVRALVGAIRQVDPDRLIFADGVDIGRSPVQGIADLGLVQSTRGYDPPSLTHYKASWASVGAPWLTNKHVPAWPMTVTPDHFKNDLIGLVVGYGLWNKDRLIKERIEPWSRLEAKGVKVHVGEWGVYNHTPHDVTLAFMRDELSLWKERKWGYALWELRGGFGVLDSNRSDVKYETVKGFKLDRKMLELLRAF